MNDDKRPGEVQLAVDPATAVPDAGVVFIGHIESPWKVRADCPRNLRRAREHGLPATLVVDEPYRPGLAGLEPGAWIFALYWMHGARRDLVVQHPRLAERASGVFSLRSPVRPNPLALGLVRILAIDPAAGRIDIDATDALDGTPLVDIKPWIATVDQPVAVPA